MIGRSELLAGIDGHHPLGVRGEHRTCTHQAEAKVGWGACAHDSRRINGGSGLHIAEQPARLQLDNRSLLAEWKPAYKRGYVMQASLAIVGGLFGLLAYLSTLDWRWLLCVFR
jgi:hypothetical protein